MNVDFDGTSLTGNIVGGITNIARLRIYSIGGADQGARGVFLDDITVTTTPVPEPSGTALLGLGCLALILRRRR